MYAHVGVRGLLILVMFTAFWKGWDMTLVILAAMPVLIIVGAAIGTVSASLGKVASGAAMHLCLCGHTCARPWQAV